MPPKALPDSSGLSRVEATRPAARHPGGEAPVNNAQPANRKSERMARRELLYAVVRQAMVRAGVLSAGYKFKVLSLDARGRQFMVMVDLARNYAPEPARLAEIEALIAQGAKARHDIVVTAVYWRNNEHVAVGDPTAQPKPPAGHAGQAAHESRPEALDSHPAALDSGPARLEAASGPRAAARYEPIHADEVRAFKNALAAGVAAPAALAAASSHGASARAFDGSAKQGPQSYTLLTGFEDTELPDPGLRMPMLSGTQYGDVG
jgi:hypothetical protein